MAVILKNGALFLHIPKTGGTWVTRVLREARLLRSSIGHRHANLDHLLAPGWQGLGRRIEWIWKRGLLLRTHPRPFTFCFVRHPLDWYESYYRYKSQPAIAWERDGERDNFHRWHPNAVLNGLGQGPEGEPREFNDFVSEAMDRFPGYVSALYAHYTFRPVDFVGRQESLRDDLVEVLGRMGCDFDPALIQGRERINRSRAPEERLEWDPAVRARALRLERAALERFGYDPDE
jgi:hypothetical protein